MSPLRAVMALLFCAVFGLSLAARAQSDEDLKRARKWFAEGDQAEVAGDCAGAIEKFKLALSVKETAQLQLRVGRCQEKLGRFKDALASFARGGQLATGDAALVELAGKMQSDLAAKMPRLTIKSGGAPPGATVKVDGEVVPILGEPILLDPGKHVVEAEASGRKPFRREVTLAGSDRSEVVLEMPPVEAGEGGTSSGGGLTPYPFIAFGVGAGLLGASIGLAVSGQSQLEDADAFGEKIGCRLLSDEEQEEVGAVRACEGARTPQHDEYFEKVDDANLRFGLAAGFGAGAGAAVVVGAVLLGLDLSSGAADAGAAPVAVRPYGGPGGGGISIERRF